MFKMGHDLTNLGFMVGSGYTIMADTIVVAPASLASQGLAQLLGHLVMRATMLSCLDPFL